MLLGAYPNLKLLVHTSNDGLLCQDFRPGVEVVGCRYNTPKTSTTSTTTTTTKITQLNGTVLGVNVESDFNNVSRSVDDDSQGMKIKF